MDQAIKLEVLPIVLTTWSEWKQLHPETTVLSADTGYQRDYNVEPYKQYFQSKDLMFPVPIRDNRLAPKDFIFALRAGTKIRAYPLDLLLQKKMLRDTVGEINVVLVANAEVKSVRAYRCETDTVDSKWEVSEDFLTSPDGTQKCARLPGNLAYWFGWYAQFPHTDLYEDSAQRR